MSLFILVVIIAAIFIAKAIKQDRKADQRAYDAARAQDAKRILDARKARNQGKTTVTEFRVAGTSFNTEALMHFAEENDDFYLSKRERFENLDDSDGDREWEYTFRDPSVALIPEPDNEYDPNAIRVEFDGLKVGYIPKHDCQNVKQIIDAGNCTLSGMIGGGTFREMQLSDDWDPESDKPSNYDLVEDEIPLYAKVFISQTTLPDEIVCVHCGAAVVPGANFCAQCGERII